jgi:hypothetical protein
MPLAGNAGPYAYFKAVRIMRFFMDTIIPSDRLTSQHILFKSKTANTGTEWSITARRNGSS